MPSASVTVRTANAAPISANTSRSSDSSGGRRPSGPSRRALASCRRFSTLAMSSACSIATVKRLYASMPATRCRRNAKETGPGLTPPAKNAGIVKHIRGEARLTEANIQEALREVRIALLEADVALPVVKHFIDAVRAKALGAEVIGSLTPGQALVGVVHRSLTELMGEANAPLDLATQPPAVILMAGLQGSGKTTTSGKLARLLVEQKKKVALVSCDVYRPAAIE